MGKMVQTTVTADISLVVVKLERPAPPKEGSIEASESGMWNLICNEVYLKSSFIEWVFSAGNL